VTSYERWVGEDGGGPAEVWGAVMTDGLMRLPAEQLLAAHAAGGGGETRAYSFAWKPGGRAAPMRSFHAVDLPFTFGTFDREGWREFLGAGPDAEGLSTTMRRAWAAFARDGRPDRVLSSGWDRWQPVGRSTLVLADPVRQVVDPLAERRTAWESIGKAS
jgi:para-nitrobenzyl esterase